jgi:hypothetical protein
MHVFGAFELDIPPVLPTTWDPLGLPYYVTLGRERTSLHHPGVHILRRSGGAAQFPAGRTGRDPRKSPPSLPSCRMIESGTTWRHTKAMQER